MSYKKEVTELTCSWENCDNITSIVRNKCGFVKHVSSHIPFIKVVEEDGEEMYECSWKNCSYYSQNSSEICRHVKYHAYHTRLMSLGAAFSKFKSLPPCKLPLNPFILHDEELKCMWKNCVKSFTCQETFIIHVAEVHVKQAKSNSEERFRCLWKDCIVDVPRRSKLFCHVRIHTGEKLMACPNCGQSFVDSSKFSSHCYRQVTDMKNGFKCSHCVKVFSTESLLKDHTRVHIQSYKCPMCDLTCRAPTTLITHIRYRHLDHKSFKCPLCPYSCKKHYDLRSHLIKHKTEKLFCHYPDCEYSTKRQYSLEKHVEKNHEPEKLSKFACHLCDKTFTNSSRISVHLKSVHKIEKPLGFSRFFYRLDEDGMKRLQTTRLESIPFEEDQIEDRNSSIDGDHSDPEFRSTIAGSKISVEIVDTSGKLLQKNTISGGSELPKDTKIVAVISENEAVFS